MLDRRHVNQKAARNAMCEVMRRLFWQSALSRSEQNLLAFRGANPLSPVAGDHVEEIFDDHELADAAGW